MQVFKACAGGGQPVLEHHYVWAVGVGFKEVTQSVDSKSDKRVVLLRREGAGASELGVIAGAVDKVPSGNDHVMATAEVGGNNGLKLLLSWVGAHAGGS